MFLAGRGVAGAGAAGISTCGLSIVAAVSPVAKRPLFTSLVMATYAIGMVIAPVLGGAWTEKVSWRWCFYMNLPCGAVTVIGTLLLPRRFDAASRDVARSTNVADWRAKFHQLDIFGCVLFMGSLIMALVALQWGGQSYPWGSSTVIGLFVGSGIGFTSFIALQAYKGEKAMIPFEVVSQRSVALSVTTAFLLYAAMIPPIYYLPECFQVIGGFGALQSGLRTLPLVVCQVIGVAGCYILARGTRYYNASLLLGVAIMWTAAGLCTTLSARGTPIFRCLGKFTTRRYA